MKHLLSIFSIALAAFAFTSCGGDEPEPNPTPKPNKPTVTEDLSAYKHINASVRDLALIYQGGAHRIDWTESDFAGYVSHRFMGGTKDEWLFDGFLFLEFTSGTNGGKQYTAGYGQPNATKVEWEWYLDRLFEKGKSLDALNSAIEKKKKLIGEPKTKHKVALTCFVPIADQKDWGELNGKTLLFTREADRTAAGEWFIDQLVNRFEEGGYDNLELYGIYMICEEVGAIRGFVERMKKHIATKNLEFVWIPYFNAAGAGDWKTWGFDIAYQQPNHFFSASTPDSRLDDAIKFAKSKGMGVEFECDERALSQSNPNFQYRMKAYIDYFEKYGIWYDTPVAYYTGNHLFLDFLQNPSPENTQIFDRVCKYIVNRRKAAEAE